MVLLYDRTFVAGSFLAAVRKRSGMYVGLAATWGVLAAMMKMAGNRGGTAGDGNEFMLSWWQYALTEPGVILHYLRISVWPGGLCVYWYGCPSARTLVQILPGAAAVAALVAASIWGLLGNRKWGYLPAWFLVILLPTSSFVPILSPIFEHRMYLSLAGVAVGAVIGAYLLWDNLAARQEWFEDGDQGRWTPAWVGLALVVVALGWGTIQPQQGLPLDGGDVDRRRGEVLDVGGRGRRQENLFEDVL